jgi:tetratricopeptide (TPR) repeat protein
LRASKSCCARHCRSVKRRRVCDRIAHPVRSDRASRQRAAGTIDEQLAAPGRNARAWRRRPVIGLGKIFVGRAEENGAHVAEACASARRYSGLRLEVYRGLHEAPLRQLGQAATYFRRSIEANRNYPSAYFSFAVALAQLGRLDEARSAAKAGLALDPAFAISRVRASWRAMSDDPTFLAGLERNLECLRKAGVPEQ